MFTTVPLVVSCPGTNWENSALKTSWPWLLTLRMIWAWLQSHTVMVWSGSLPWDTNMVPSGLKPVSDDFNIFLTILRVCYIVSFLELNVSFYIFYKILILILSDLMAQLVKALPPSMCHAVLTGSSSILSYTYSISSLYQYHIYHVSCMNSLFKSVY